MRERAVAAFAVVLLLATAAAATDATLPPLRGWVTDAAGVLSPAERSRLSARIESLRGRTGAEIAVVTVRTTAPLDDFSYALRVAEEWKPGRAGRDSGVVFLVATEDRKLRVLVGYGLEGILPDGLVGQIQDREVVPEFRAGRVGAGIVRGVEALADRIERGLAGEAPPPAEPRARRNVPGWVVLLVILVIIALMRYEARNQARGFRGRRRWGRPPIVWFPGGFGGGRGGFGGFGGGGGGFGGFGGGRFGGGGAGRSW